MRDYPWIILTLAVSALAMLAFSECGERREMPHADQYVVESDAALFPLAFVSVPYTYATAAKCGDRCVEWSFDKQFCGMTRIGILRCEMPDSRERVFPDSHQTAEHRRWRP